MENETRQGEEAKPDQDGYFRELKQWIEACRDFNKDLHCDLNKLRAFAAGDMHDDDESGLVRANLFHSTLQALIPVIYARNPDFSIGPSEGVTEEEMPLVKSFARGLSVCVSRALKEAKIKKIAKACVRSAFTSRVAWVKLVYQRDYDTDPIIKNRIEDAQDNVANVNALIKQLDDDDQIREKEAIREQLQQTIASLEQQVEVVVSEGINIDRIEPDHLLIDPAITNLADWRKSRRVIQVIMMAKSEAEAVFGKKLDKADTFTWQQAHKKSTDYEGKKAVGDPLVKVYEIWDKTTMTVYTMVSGCSEWAKEPYIPERQPEQWYPFFELSFFPVDGKFMPLSLVELLQELIDEYNANRTQLAEHRELSIPTWIADKGTDRDSLERKRDAVLGEIVLVDAQGRPLNQVIEPAAPPPYNPAVYDTSPILRDIDMISGVTDAQRNAVGRAKTLGEAEMMNQSSTTRSSELQDVIEDWMQEIATATAEILLQEYTPQQVARIAGAEAASNWPTMEKWEVFDKVDIDIRAGTTGKPNKQTERENWQTLFPLIMQLQDIIQQIEATGGDANHKRELLKETLRRLDERIDIDLYLPQKPETPALPGAMDPTLLQQQVVQ